MKKQVFEKIAELEAKIRILQEEHKQTQLDKLEQNDVNRKELESIFEIDSNDDIDTTFLDGLLKDYVDPKQNSQEMVRSVRDS